MKFWFENKLGLHSGNHSAKSGNRKIQYGCQADILTVVSIKLTGFYPYTQAMCYWSLDPILKGKILLESGTQTVLIFKAELKLESGNQRGKSEWFDSCDRPSNLTKIGSKSSIFSARVTLQLDGWPRQIIGHLFYTTSSFVHNFKSIGELKQE